jgi:hypothetical protein
MFSGKILYLCMDSIYYLRGPEVCSPIPIRELPPAAQLAFFHELTWTPFQAAALPFGICRGSAELSPRFARLHLQILSAGRQKR